MLLRGVGLSGSVYKNLIPLLFISYILSYFLKIQVYPPLSLDFTTNLFFRDKLPINMKMLVFFLAKCVRTAAKTMFVDRRNQKTLALLYLASKALGNAANSSGVLASHAVVFRGVILPFSPQTPAYRSSTFLSHCFPCEAIYPITIDVLSDDANQINHYNVRICISRDCFSSEMLVP